MHAARLFAVAAFLMTCLVPFGYADEDMLNGLWMETANFPASSILKFERDGDRIVGRYRQVSAPQKHWGFAVGETVIRGAFNGNVFRGEVLLKLTKDFIDRCPDVAVGWAPIELTKTEPGKLYGRWRQTHFSRSAPCTVVGQSWQLYGLEKIKVE